MLLTELKRLAAQRTKGEWPSDNIVCWEFEPYGWSGAGPYIKPEEDDDDGDRGQEQAMEDAKWIAAINNSADKLIAVAEAAQLVREEMRLRPFSLDSAPFDILDEKLAALEEG